MAGRSTGAARRFDVASQPDNAKRASALIGWKKPITGTSKPNHARSTWTIRRAEKEARHTQATATNAYGQRQHEEDEPEQHHEVTEARVQAKPVFELVLVDGPLVDLARRRTRRSRRIPPAG